MRPALLLTSFVVLTAAGCSNTAAPAPADLAMAAAPDLAPMELRGQRYCEVLVATLNAPNVHVAVYNTIGLNDCPDDVWSHLDTKQIAMQEGAAFVVLNGPRYWMLDAFVTGVLADPTIKVFGAPFGMNPGTMEMRQAGAIDLPLAQAMNMTPYTIHMIQRDTVVRFSAGKPVFELVDPMGKIYDMQSYSIQKVMQTEADLATLGARLTLPMGWTYRTRTLASDLMLTAVNNIGLVVQDDFEDTFQQSQQ